MKPRTFVIVAALAIAIIGVVLMSLNVTARAAGGQSVSCGTGFSKDTSQAEHEKAVGDLTAAMIADQGQPNLLGISGASYSGFEQACDSALSTRRTWGFVLMGVGVLGLLGGIMVQPAARRETEDA
ncbi:hypothetical protein VSH64_24775 [Amycolatopsis rhabdoformis]|uniref:Aminopeptidase n=1 Tax=Amycolatopsis rhabdoformis TaxID=1448059 RepID=A0ABZ1HUP4_9PSEU|nr:hypothetical protein [Amycolatopsis rhabdoformis]WSE26092.1 hypothetical protein VSH64_24775 [Amycolatopsis rhabdoformis]